MAAHRRDLVAAGVILVLDNRDSYTFNLVQLLRERTDREVRVVSADDGETALELLASGEVAGVVISPGPGHPDDPDYFAASGALIDAVLERGGLAGSGGSECDALPMLGVCLGHQGLARRFGYEVVAAPRPRHGWLSPIQHTDTGIFAGMPQGATVTRYHSLAIEPGKNPDPRLHVTARSEDGVIQGFEIEGAPWYGVQFHPESVACEHGALVLERFLDAVEQRSGSTLHVATARWELDDFGLSARQASRAVYRGVLERGHGSFWLDSALPDADQARWSMLGDASGRGRIERVELSDIADMAVLPASADPMVRLQEGLRAIRHTVGAEDLPFRGGAVGWFGYELGMRLLGVEVPQPPVGSDPEAGPKAPAEQPAPPASWWVWPERFVVVDHRDRVLTVCVASTDPAQAQEELGEYQRRVLDVLGTEPGPQLPHTPGTEPETDPGTAPLIPGAWRDDRPEYLDKIRRCQDALVAGESYELCLTNTFTADVQASAGIDPADLFEDLIEHHPTPYAGLIEADAELAVVSASPERLLRGRNAVYSTKPIKGTAPRGDTPDEDAAQMEFLRTDPKTFAENLMIVDLLRNDLGRVSVPGSVEVTELMAVETYASVHQLVSTIEAVAEPGVDAVDVVRALFPGGSMTGAPKVRSVQILHELEAAARGVYSGALGFFSADGAVELSIVIRTAVRSGGRWTIGAGGAIVLDSDPETEADEVDLKASALRRAMHRVAG
ncbi:chorismate-binding protein [Citricoccus muralis]|uniref:aminodeoxychorismate synthase n=1 Tax=Citricoccus muralis TaxID=169134 RepID=A0ABY8H9I2_9MICC|nr:chorismate-binding protein [Citricoccus muralis]WFP17489.1 chorismate-binding protein [Citricoccus muralis]